MKLQSLGYSPFTICTGLEARMPIVGAMVVAQLNDVDASVVEERGDVAELMQSMWRLHVDVFE